MFTNYCISIYTLIMANWFPRNGIHALTTLYTFFTVFTWHLSSSFLVAVLVTYPLHLITRTTIFSRLGHVFSMMEKSCIVYSLARLAYDREITMYCIWIV